MSLYTALLSAHHFFVNNSAARPLQIVERPPNHSIPALITTRLRGNAFVVLHRLRLGLWLRFRFRFRFRFRSVCRSGSLGQGSGSGRLLPCCNGFLFCSASLGKCRFRWHRLAPLLVIAVDLFLDACRNRSFCFCHEEPTSLGRRRARHLQWNGICFQLAR